MFSDILIYYGESETSYNAVYHAIHNMLATCFTSVVTLPYSLMCVYWQCLCECVLYPECIAI